MLESAIRTVEEASTTKLTITLELDSEDNWCGRVDGWIVVVTGDRADAADVLADYLIGKP